jgi:Integrase core domain
VRGSRSSRPEPHKRPKASYVRFQAEQPNEYWQLDITHWELADGSAVEILNVIDDHSRRCLDSHAQRTFKGPDVDRRFRVTATTYGDPASLLSDNAAVFTGAPRRYDRVAREVTLAVRGIRFNHSRPYHPQTCGKVERFHQPLKSRSPASHRPHRYVSCNAGSTPSAPTTTTSARTAPSAATPRPGLCRQTERRPERQTDRMLHREAPARCWSIWSSPGRAAIGIRSGETRAAWPENPQQRHMPYTDRDQGDAADLRREEPPR